MSKSQLIGLGLAFENIKTGTISLDVDRLSMVSKEKISEIVEDVKSFTEKKNFYDIIFSLAESGIECGYYEKSVVSEDNQSVITIKIEGQEYLKKVVTYKYTYLKDSQAGDERVFLNGIREIIEKNMISVPSISKFTSSFSKMKKGHNIEVNYDVINYSKKTEDHYSFDKIGFKSREELKEGNKFLEEKRISLSTKKLSVYGNGKVTREVITDSSKDTNEELLYKYDNDGALECIKKTLFEKKADEYEKKSVAFVYYKDNNPVQAKITNEQFGTKEYKFKEDKLAINDNGTVVIVEINPVNFIFKKEGLEHLKELGALDGGLLELKNNVSEIYFPYDELFEKIYYDKTKTVIGLIKKREVIVYIADKGNVCIYNKQGEKVAYIPRKSLGNLYGKIAALPGVLIEQKIKNSDNVNDIKKVYWLGNQIGDKKGIYAFDRVIKALCQNDNTPSDILNDITQAVITGKYDYQNMVYLASNKSTSVETLQMIIDSNPSIIVKDALDANPNKPRKLEELEDANEILNRVLK